MMQKLVEMLPAGERPTVILAIYGFIAFGILFAAIRIAIAVMHRGTDSQ